MKNKTNIKLPLTDLEKVILKKKKVKIAELINYAADELEMLLGAKPNRARQIHALAQFQKVPSIGIKFAEDLVFLGYYSFNELKNSDAAKLTNDYEQKKGFWVDPCVEDQFRLVVNFANTGDLTKSWWNFTEERKQYRMEKGYPASRPKQAWHETLGR